VTNNQPTRVGQTNTTNFMTVALNAPTTLELTGNAIVPFNRVLTNNNNNLLLSPNGTITINSPGNYIVNWWLAVNNPADDTNNIAMALLLRQNADQEFPSTEVSSSRIIVGNASFTVNNVPATLSLINASPNVITYPTTNTVAMLTISQVK